MKDLNNEGDVQKTSSRKITVGLIVSWILGVLFVLSGLTTISSSPASAFIMLLLGAVVLPPVNKFVDNKWNFHLSRGVKGIIVIIGLIVSFSVSTTSSIPSTKEEGEVVEDINDTKVVDEVSAPVKVEKQTVEKVTTEKTTDSNQEQGQTSQNVTDEVTEEPQRQDNAPEAEAVSAGTQEDQIIKEECLSDWPNDPSTRSYCEKQQYDGLATLAQGKPGDITEDQYTIIHRECANDWPRDFSTRAYCEKQQYDGVRALNNGKPGDITDEQYAIIHKECEYDWPTDFSTRAYCEKQQYDGVRSLNQSKPSHISQAEYDAAKEECTKQWPRDFSTRAYCVKQSF